MKITVVEKLGDMVAYSPKEIRVLKSVYDLVPQDTKEDFNAVLVSAKQSYDAKVSEAKARGEKPKSASYKKETVEGIRSWLKKKGFYEEQATKRIVTREPRIPSNGEVTRVVQKKDLFIDVNPDEDEISRMFENFDSEELSDERIEEEHFEEDSVDLDDSLFEDMDMLDGLDDF